MKYTAGQAAQAANVSTATITRAIKSGKISAVKDHAGAWQIEPVELHRVFHIKSPAKDSAIQMKRDAMPLQDSALQAEVEVLRARLEASETLNADRADQIQYLRAQVETEAAERRRAQAILADLRPRQTEPTPPDKRRVWWPFNRR